MAMVSAAQVTLTTLVTFDETNGAYPFFMVPTQGADGNFYGTTYGGGTGGVGTVFKMTPAGALTTLHNFCPYENCTDGLYPSGSLVQTRGGDFYGVTEGDGSEFSDCEGLARCGTVFKITPGGALTTLYSFCSQTECTDGYNPYAGLVQATNGNFYGTTLFGGYCFCTVPGTVFELTPAGNLTTLIDFNGSNGALPNGVLVEATNGSLYGETGSGPNNDGTIFEMTLGGKLTTLYLFAQHDAGVAPVNGLIQASDGDLYGVSAGSGGCIGQGCSTIFKITPAGELTTVYEFCSLSNCADGTTPYGPLVQATDGNFYGTTSEGGAYGAGTVFEITPGGSLTTLYSFCALANCADGMSPFSGLLQATSGIFYGTTSGDFENGPPYGTIFSLSTGLGPFVKIEPASGKEGATIGIFGQGFNSSSSVQFGGVQATSVTLSGSTFLKAKVPAGALTGSVTVTTDGTTLTSNQQFRVTPEILSFNPPSGPAGTQVTITGTGFTQTLGVGFGNNTPAEFTVNSDTQITATVPTGAQTGPVGVETKGGTAISSATFTVN
jgi:uncharacterized repeat protein (TIGR03803 family)